MRLLIRHLSVTNFVGHFKALALSGMSQGGASVFNAALENPAICDYLIQDRPVCMNIPALAKLKQPTLLAFDTEDDGHPIKLGRRMAGQIPMCRFLSWTTSTQPFWWTDNFIQV
jgi:pimeloyl-ACP methyl ester carboxylesterase